MGREQLVAANPIVPFVRARGHAIRSAGENFVTSACPVRRHDKPGHRPVLLYTVTQSWFCHDCEVGGSVIDWLSHEKNISVDEAMRELGGGSNGEAQKPVSTFLTCYDYTDENGLLLYQICRFVPKDFRGRRPDGKGGFIWNLKDVRRVLYRLPEVLKAQLVCLTEGEKDADNLRKLGFAAATNCGGKKKWLPEYSESLRGKDVIIFGDNDEGGREHVALVARALSGIAATVKAITVPEPHKDVSDYVDSLPEEAKRKAIDELIEAAKSTEAKNLSARPVQQSDEAAIRGEIVRILTNSKLSAFEQREAISKLVVPALLARGRFFYHIDMRDLKSAMFFDNGRKCLERIRSDWFQVWLSDWLSINKIEMPFKAAASAVETAALTDSISTGIISESFWAVRPGAFYLSNGDAAFVKITAGQVQFMDNGADGVLFARGNTLAPWKLTQPLDPFETCSVFKDANCAAEHGPYLLRLWILSLPSNPHKKPPLCLAGEVGSGKTRLAEGIAELYGLPFIANNVTDDFGDKDFWVSADAGGLCTLDNCDSRIKWLADAVAAHATAGHRDKRKLYTDSEKVTLHAHAWLCLTTANPTFASDAGLADRLLLVRMNRRTDETADSKLSSEINEHRDGALSFIAQTLSKALADNKPVVPAGLNLRHPDFATFAVKIGRAIGCESQAINAITAAEKDKSLFCLENDFIASALLDYLNAAQTFTGTAAELRDKLIELDPDLQGKLSAKRLGKRLLNLWPHLEKCWQSRNGKRVEPDQ